MFASVFMVFSVVLHLAARQIFFQGLGSSGGLQAVHAYGAMELFIIDSMGALIGNLSVNTALDKRVRVEKIITILWVFMATADMLICFSCFSGMGGALRLGCFCFGVSRALFHLGFGMAMQTESDEVERNRIMGELEVVIAVTTVILPMIYGLLNTYMAFGFGHLYSFFAVLVLVFLCHYQWQNGSKNRKWPLFFRDGFFNIGQKNNSNSTTGSGRWDWSYFAKDVLGRFYGSFKCIGHHEICVFFVYVLLQMGFSLGVGLAIEWQVDGKTFAWIVMAHGVGIGLSALLCLPLNNYLTGQCVGLISWLSLWLVGVLISHHLKSAVGLGVLYLAMALFVPALLANLRLWMADQNGQNERVKNKMAIFGVMETLGLLFGSVLTFLVKSIWVDATLEVMVILLSGKIIWICLKSYQKMASAVGGEV